MAIINLTSADSSSLGGTRTITWAALGNGDTGQPLESNNLSDKTVQIFGTFGTGGSVTLQGSNDPRVISNPGSDVWFPLTDPQGNAITKTAASGEQIMENPRWVRPSVTAGDGSTSLTVIISARGA